MAPAVLVERKRLRQEVPCVTRLDLAHGEDSGGLGVKGEANADNKLSEKEKVHTRDAAIDVTAQQPGLQESGPEDTNAKPSEPFSPEMMAPSMKGLQRGASSLLRFLVAVSMRQATPAAVSRPQEGGRPNSRRDSSPSRGEGVHQVTRGDEKRVSPSACDRIIGEGDETAAGAVVASAMQPTRERSMYGTPFQHMQTHVDSLHQVLFGSE